jgi:hypothetical protein
VDKVKARLDTDRKATPKTRLIAHVRAGDCVSPFHVAADAIEDIRTGERIALV